MYKLVLDYHEHLSQVYDERYTERYGPWRACVGNTLMRYLDCGVLANGFLRVKCTTPGCRHEVLVPWSCKRNICPSCGQRRSLEFAEFVNAEVLEDVPCRHVVFTIPSEKSGPFSSFVVPKPGMLDFRFFQIFFRSL